MAVYVYMLRCGDDSLYTGTAADVPVRLRQHSGQAPGGARYTRAKGVRALEAAWQCPNRSRALRLEYRIKQLPRPKKLRLAAGEALPKGFEDCRAADRTQVQQWRNALVAAVGGSTNNE